MASVNATTSDVVFLSAGINDWDFPVTASQYGINLTSINSQLVSTSDLIFVTPPPGDPARGQSPYDTQETYVDTMLAVGKSLNRPVIDLWRTFGGVVPPSSFDGKHLTAAGYAVWAAAGSNGVVTGLC
jgi:lysophospholipase L1-like esterase